MRRDGVERGKKKEGCRKKISFFKDIYLLIFKLFSKYNSNVISSLATSKSEILKHLLRIESIILPLTKSLIDKSCL